jgi:hypothetical protein
MNLMNTLRHMLGAVAMTTVLVATSASAQGVGRERETIARQDAVIPDRSDASRPTKAKKNAEGARGTRAFASAPGERSLAARSRATSAAFDGDWSVVIVTQSGSCDRAYRYGVRIENGEVLNAGGESVALEGRVAPSGAVQVSVAAGGQEAHGTGRLSRVAGSGVWRGEGSAGSCAGVWQAERRE